MGAIPAIAIDAVLARYGLSREAFCDGLGLGMATVRSWHRGDRKPSLFVCQLAEERLGIPKHELRPDIWPPPPPERRTKASAMAI
jgi:transcriptional regulator with XRE-family HTH domain